MYNQLLKTILIGIVFSFFGSLWATPPFSIKWSMLKKLKDVSTIPSELQILQEKTVSMAGYMVALHTNQLGVKTFLLVPVAGQCIHLPPPPTNQMIYIEMEGDKVANFTNDAIIVKGTFLIRTAKSQYGNPLYTIKANGIFPY